MVTVFIRDIDWDREDDDVALPTEVMHDFDVIEFSQLLTDDTVGDWLSDEYGYCHRGFRMSEMK